MALGELRHPLGRTRPPQPPTLIGVFLRAHPGWVLLVTAFLGGAVVLNVLKKELPEERESRFGAFALGALLYGALLLSLS